jgi:hypothetical protein
MKDKIIIGLTEKVTIYSDDKKKSKEVTARIDTGAASNSIDASLAADMNLGPIIRTTVVKSANGQSLRPVVDAEISIGDEHIKTTFTIADRSKMRYKILVGRKSLTKRNFLIDPNK